MRTVGANLGTRVREFARTPYGLIFAAYLVLRVASVVGIGVARAPDSQSWLAVDFSGVEIRLWTIPLFFKLLPADTLRELGQAVLSIACWTWLAAVVARALTHPRLKLAGFATVLTLALVTQVTNWDTIILGESVAISITVALYAAWWTFVQRTTTATTVLLCVASLLWAFLRHVDIVMTVPIAVIVGISLLRSRDRMRVAVLATLVVTLAWGLPTLGKNPFNEEEVLVTIISERILTSPDRTDWFVEHGMPGGPAVRRLAGSFFTYGHGSTPIRHTKRLFRWIQHHGRSTYLEFLITHPGYLLLAPAKDAIGPDASVLSGAVYGRVRAVLPAPVESVLFDGSGSLIFLAVISALLALAAFGVRGWRRRELVPGLAVVLSLVLYWVTYHGVASEPERHYLVSAIAIRVSLLVIVLLAIDHLLARRARPPEARGKGTRV